MRTFIVCTILVFCCLAIGCRGWAFRVPTENMLPTIKVGDTCIINKYAYTSKPIERFDIVVFDAPVNKEIGILENTKIISRIIALSGEKIEIKNGKVFINDELLKESFGKVVSIDDAGNTVDNFASIVVPKDECFLLGDNRTQSYDSRYWKNPTIKKQEILGKVVQIIPAEEK